MEGFGHKRLPGWLGPVIGPLFGALIGLLSLRKMPGASPALVILFPAALGLVAGLLLWLADALSARRKRRSPAGRPPAPSVAPAGLARRIGPLLLSLVFFGAVTAMWATNPNRSLTVLAVPGALLGVLLALYLYVRWRDRVFFRALRLAGAGDTEGAVALLREQLQRAGPSERAYHQLAGLLLVQQNWEEALHMVEEAERLGGPQPGFLASKGWALWKLGRGQEALPYLQEAARLLPADLITACNYGCLLGELGRAPEAAEMLRRAERLYATQRALGGAAVRQVREQALEELRRKVSEAPPGAGEKWGGPPVAAGGRGRVPAPPGSPAGGGRLSGWECSPAIPH
jgi:tetratricopeptide (TPR) repeat protein